MARGISRSNGFALFVELRSKVALRQPILGRVSNADYIHRLVIDRLKDAVDMSSATVQQNAEVDPDIGCFLGFGPLASFRF